MQNIVNETVGNKFQTDLLQSARDKTLTAIEMLAAQISPSMSEADAREKLEIILKSLGSERSWHPPQIRFGKNTILPFGVPSDPEVRLEKNDIFFIDIGPVFNDHEGDVGRTCAVGHEPDHHKCAQDARQIWLEVRDRWYRLGSTGPELYSFAAEQAESRGWKLSLQKANGHRIADFPHAARFRGSIESWTETPASHRWILEIQIRHPEKPFGAFYEDLLN
jgi:Xaa-Pro aminopeptidase